MKAIQKNDPKLYTYRVMWSEEDEEFVGACVEFPSLSWLEEDQGDALKGISNLVAETIQDMEDNGEKVPSPLSLRKYSGKFLVRVGPSLHHQLTISATEEGVSLNSFVNKKLAVA